MKKLFYLATALVALASCTSDDFVGGDDLLSRQDDINAIKFSSVSQGTTRAEHVGADAAELLNKHFTVSGFKGDGTGYTTENLATGTVFDNYVVNWAQNTAATTESNTSDWEYVGIAFALPSNLYVASDDKNKQTIKYWDYSASQYDFVAYSTGTATAIATGTPSAGQVLVTAIDAANLTSAAYTLQGAADDLQKCYIADLVTAYKEDKSPVQPKFQDEVKLTFRSLGSKVRVALYETIPGYSVKDVKFYADDATTTIATGATATTATLFTTGTAVKDNFYTKGTYTVKFPTIGATNLDKSDYNKAHVVFAAESDGKVTSKTFGDLKKTTKEYKEKTDNVWLGRTLPTASYAGTTSPYYVSVLPNEDGTVLELRIDYTLESIDGSGEEIKVHGAKAFVPDIYAAWKPNYAYTYIFKISDNTNGWTSTAKTDPAGLYPITFDAVAVDSEENTQATITTVAMPSITTYQKGHDVTKNEYAAGDIYVQVMADGTLKSDLATKGQLYSLSAAKTEAEVMDALNIQTASTETTITGRNGLVLTKVTSDATITAVPGADGNNITVAAGEAAKFTAAAGNYAYVYDATPATAPAASYYYSAEALTTQPTDWATPGLWYADPNGATAAPTTFAAGTYYKKYTNLNKVYGVKVIKVQ
ncbi:MAG: hypothetical protein IJQ76_05980 [Prevotella sp.]|nr:hypothetical protein [Prevotella sp.]